MERNRNLFCCLEKVTFYWENQGMEIKRVVIDFVGGGGGLFTTQNKIIEPSHKLFLHYQIIRRISFRHKILNINYVLFYAKEKYILKLVIS